MSETWKIVLIAFYLQTQTLMVDGVNTAFDKMIDSSMKTSIQPCDDFYSYACGNYNEQTVFNASLKHKDLLDYANHQYNMVIINLLDIYGRQEHKMEESCLALTEKVRTYFESCRKVTKRNLTRYLLEVKPGPDLNWPILENESSEISNKWPHGKSFDVFALLAKLNSLGVSNPIFHLNNFNGKEETHGILIHPPFSDSSTLPSKEKMLNMLSSIEVENPVKIVEDAVETHKKLQDILKNSLEMHNKHIKTKVSDLVQRYPNLSFQTYFLENMGKELPLNTSVVLFKPLYFDDLNNKLWPSFDKSKLCNYLMMFYLELFDATTEFNSIYCVEELRKMFNTAVNFLYYRQNFDYQEKVVKPDITEIFINIVDMLRIHLQRHDLELTIYQMESLREKLASIRLNIGNLPDHASCKTIKELYSSVPALDENEYYKNHLIMKRFQIRNMYKTPFFTPMYSLERPKIILSYNYLMPPVYDFEYNNLGKYSVLGFILAQLLVRHCNLMGINDGKMSELSKPLASALECLQVDQGSGIPYRRVEDNLAIEVIRKIVTLKFFNLQPTKSVSTWKKHFFLNMAQHFCSTDNNTGNHHDTKRDRLNRIAMYTEGFSQAFNCPEGSVMNPAEKCQI